MKKFFVICFLTIVHWQISFAQLSDDFSDNDFTTNPTWSGTSNDFIVNVSHQLQLSSLAAGTSYLSASCPTVLETDFEWLFYVKQGFSPSGSNYGRIYLVSNECNLTGSLNGYYLQFGEAGSNDAIELFKQTGVKSTSICRATNDSIASSFKVRIKVLRSNLGEWKLYTDYKGGTNFVLESTGTDNTYSTSSCFGVVCTYTASNATKFYYDDFYVGPELKDNVAPTIQTVSLKSATELDIVFSEDVDQKSAEATSNYSANYSLGFPQKALLKADKKTVQLTFSKSFPNGISCTLSIFGVKDTSGNAVLSASKDFLFFQSLPVSRKDVVITEIFPDPSPKIGLPEVEYVELLNRSTNPIDLNGWKFSDGTSTGNFSSFILFPEEYLILTSTSNASLFLPYGKVIGLSNFPTLNNTGDALTLKDADGLTIDSIKYTDRWYKDDDKKQGGWSLELIDPSNVCAEADNWIGSEDPQGGTPAKQNSVFANKPDLTAPQLISAIPSSANSIVLMFNEKLEKTPPLKTNFVFEPEVRIKDISFMDASLTSISVFLNEEFDKGVTYSITVNKIYDCSGNGIQPDFSTAEFGLPEPADSLDIVVNEILFNPKPTGTDFVEIYNRSSKYINLKNWSTANLETGTISNSKPITSSDLLLKPFSYLVFTQNKDILKGEYSSTREENVFVVKALPTLSDDAGSIAILDDNGKMVDYFLYSKDFHSPFIKDKEGVSLERISFDRPTDDLQNWKSASSIVGFATPGYINSNSWQGALVPDESIHVEPEIFIPAYGTPDFTQIMFNFDKSGYVANVGIFDVQGHEIKQIANNEILGTEGFFRWDGDNNSGTKAHVGYYVVRFEVFDATGSIKTFHKRVVVATRF